MKAETSVHAQDGKTSLVTLTRGHRFKYVAAMLLSTSSTIFMLAVPIIGKHALDVTVEQDFGFANEYLLAVSDWISLPRTFLSYLILSAVAGVLATIAAMSVRFGRDRLSAVASEGISRRLREALYDRLHHVPMKFIDESETGDLVQRCSSDIETVRVFMHSDVDDAGRVLLFICGMVPILFWHHSTLAWFSFILIPILFFSAYFFFKSVTKLFQITDESEGALTAIIQENLTGIRVVRAFNRHDYEESRFESRNRAFRDNYVRLNRLMAIYWGGTDIVAMLQIGLVLFVGAFFYLNEQITIGELFLFLMYVSQVVWRIRHVGRLIGDAGKATVSMRRINHILNTEPEAVQKTPRRERLLGAIRFENVSLQVAEDRLALKDVSIAIKAGETIGIVGAPGSGKSTLLRTLLRIQEPTTGRVLVDDLEIADIDRKWLRQNIGIVLQEPFLYSRTLRENLLVGKADANQQELEKATREAALHPSIEAFNAGYETMIGERGVTLSGGQRQRLALARALLKSPPILILDDALSAVDSHTENEILAQLAARRGKQTTLIVAHRLSTLRNVDRVLVFVEGRLAQVGTHEELASQPGPYHELNQLQALMDESIKLEAVGRV